MLRGLLLAGLILLTGPAWSADPAQMLAGADVYRTARIGADLVEDKWVLGRDGRVTGVSHRSRNAARTAMIFFEEPVRGRWEARSDRLCVEATGLVEGPRTCLTLRKVTGTRAEYVGVADGRSWQVFVYPAGR